MGSECWRERKGEESGEGRRRASSTPESPRSAIRGNKAQARPAPAGGLCQKQAKANGAEEAQQCTADKLDLRKKQSGRSRMFITNS